MALSPFTASLASGARADSATETFDVPTRGRKGLVLVTDVTAIGNGHSFVQGAAVTLPLVVGTNSQSQFVYDGDTYTIANGTYSTLAALATAVGAATKTGPVAFSTVVTVTASGTGLLFTSVPSGVNAKVFGVGTHDALVLLGLTDTWTIAHTEAAGTDASYSQTVTISGVDPISGKTWTILAGAAMTTVSTQLLQVHPAMTAAANAVANALLPATVRITITHTTDDSITRTVAIQLVS